MIKNDGTYFIVTFEEDKKYPEEIEPFSYKGIELFVAKSYCNIRQFNNEFYTVTEKSTGNSLDGVDHNSIEAAKSNAIAKIDRVGIDEVLASINRGIERNKELGVV